MSNGNCSRLRRRVALLTLACLILLPSANALAWGPGGHMMVAQIALDRLNPRAKAEVRRLIALRINPAAITGRSLDFVTASVWADDVKKRRGFEFSGDEHFADFPFSADGARLPRGLPKRANVIRALERYVNVLKTSRNDNERAQALRFIIHYVGDIHQPLHCSTRVDAAHRRGDGGGNEFFISLRRGGRADMKLHSFWDGGLGNFPRGGGSPNFTPPPLIQITDGVPSIISENPDTEPNLHLDQPEDFSGWAEESSTLARANAYDSLIPRGTPGPNYQRDGVAVARRRVAWGGYRLAALLNSIFPE